MRDRVIYEFGQFRLNPTEHRLLREGVPVPLGGKAFQVLLVLVRNSGHLVEKSEIVTAVWGDTFVDEGNLPVAISTVRKALGDDRSESKYIETIAKLGYRFLPSVRKLSDTCANQAHLNSETADLSLPLVLAPDATQTTAPSSTTLLQSAPTPLAEAVEVRDTRKPRFTSRYAHRVAILAIAATALIAIAFYWRSPLHPFRSHVPIHSIAVLPFAVIGSDQRTPHLGLGIEDDLILKFKERDNIEGRPASALVKYATAKVDPASIAQEQGVDAVLSGAVTITQGQARISAKLSKADGKVLWAAAYDTPLAQLSEFEDQVEREVVTAIDARQDQLDHHKDVPHDSEAFQLYVEGRYFWNKRTERGFRRSIELFQEAVLKDPTYADAYAGLADSYTLLASYGIEPAEQAYPNAKAAAVKALELDGTLAEAHTSRGMVALYYEWDWNMAGHEFATAIELNPNYSLAHTWDALYFAALGEMPEALKEAQRGQELDPLSLMATTELGRVYYWSRQYDKSVAAYRHVIEFDPYFARAHTRLGMALAAQKDYGGAIKEFQEARKLSSPDPYLDGLTGYALAMQGNTSAARKLLDNMTERSRTEFVPAFSVAMLCVGLGERNLAMDWLEKAYSDRSTYMVYARVDPLLDPLHSDPRFSALMKRMDLDVRKAQAQP